MASPPSTARPPTPVPAPSLNRKFSWQRAREQGIQCLLLMCALASVATTVGIVYVLFDEAIFKVSPYLHAPRPTPGDTPPAAETAFFQDVPLTEFFGDTRWAPQYHPRHFGIWPLVCGTFLVAGIAALIGLPLGLLSAIYLSEYASPRQRNLLKPILEILAGIPTVIYGYFALIFITPSVLRPLLQDGPRWLSTHGLPWFPHLSVDVFNAAAGGIVVGIMIIPMVSSLAEDVLRAVPRGLREAGYALGATKLDVSLKIVVPAALSGIMAAFLLALSRAIGETMAVTIAAGKAANLTLNPFRSVETMTAFIASAIQGDSERGSIEFKSLYAVALVLFLITLLMNIASQMILRRFREVYH